MPTKETVDEICSGRDPSRDYCTAKEILSHIKIPVPETGDNCNGCDGSRDCACKKLLLESKLHDVTCKRFKEIEILKWEEGKYDSAIDWNRAGIDFADKYAEKFSELYQHGVTNIRDLVRETIGIIVNCGKA